MKFLKALSLSFALAVLALAMLGAGGKGNVMPATRPDAGGAEDSGTARISDLYMHSTKAGPMPLPRKPQPLPTPAPSQAPAK